MTKKQSKATKQANAQRAAERAAAIHREREAKDRRRGAVTVTVVVVGALILLLAIGLAVQSLRDTSGQSAKPPNGVAGGYALPYGSASAPVHMTVYEDFMCPFCRHFEAGSRAMLKQYVDRGDVQVRYHLLSFLDSASNGTDYSTRSMNALGVVLDTAGPKVAKRFHDLLYENQPREDTSGLSDEQLISFAVKAGADRNRISAPIKSLKFEQWVTNSTDAASKAGVNGTPTVVIDGKTLPPMATSKLLATVKARIDRQLAG
jgi:protein-disulfide isomerase